MTTLRWNLLVIFLFFMLFFLQYKLWFQPDGLQDLFRLQKKVTAQAAENAALRASNAALLFQVERLQKSSDATEARARNELGMIKKGETFYQIVK
jgi:cell division protein FtsB